MGARASGRFSAAPSASSWRAGAQSHPSVSPGGAPRQGLHGSAGPAAGSPGQCTLFPFLLELRGHCVLTFTLKPVLPRAPRLPEGSVCGPQWGRCHACPMPTAGCRVNTDGDGGSTIGTRGHAHLRATLPGGCWLDSLAQTLCRPAAGQGQAGTPGNTLHEKTGPGSWGLPGSSCTRGNAAESHCPLCTTLLRSKCSTHNLDSCSETSVTRHYPAATCSSGSLSRCAQGESEYPPWGVLPTGPERLRSLGDQPLLLMMFGLSDP